MQNFYKECVGNTNIQLNNTSEENLQIPLEILYFVCDSYNADISLAKYHLEKVHLKQYAMENIVRHLLILVNILQNMC